MNRSYFIERMKKAYMYIGISIKLWHDMLEKGYDSFLFIYILFIVTWNGQAKRWREKIIIANLVWLCLAPLHLFTPGNVNELRLRIIAQEELTNANIQSCLLANFLTFTCYNYCLCRQCVLCSVLCSISIVQKKWNGIWSASSSFLHCNWMQ